MPVLGRAAHLSRWSQWSVGGTVLLLRAACRPRFTAVSPDHLL